MSDALESVVSVGTVVTEVSAARDPVWVAGRGTGPGLPLGSSDGATDPNSHHSKSPESGVVTGLYKVRRKSPPVPALGGSGEGVSGGTKPIVQIKQKSTDGGSRRRLFQQGARAPAFVEHPVVIHDLGRGGGGGALR